MADEPLTAASSVLPVPPTSEMETTQPEDVIKASDVSKQETVSAATDDKTKTAAGGEEATKANGESEPKPVEPSQPTATEPIQSADDIEMKDADEKSAPAETSSSAAPANGTPASSKKASIGGSSKKKSAVPEHKSKKLNRKKSRPLTNLAAQPGEYYFARMKGHAPWPSVVCDEEMLPNSLLTSRPVTAKLPDGTFRRPQYEDGGNRAHERTFPIMFLHTNEFAWIPNTELTPLDPDDDAIKNPPEKGKSKLLLSAYAKAAEGNDLSHFKTMLAEHQKALQEDLAEKEERAAELKAAKKTKKASRKSSDAAGLAEDDEMDIDDEPAVEKPKSKKRKKADESEVDEKPAKTPKTSTKLKLSEPKTPTSEASTKKKASKPKPKAPKGSSDEDGSTPKVEEKVLTPAEQKEVKERKVLYYRHKLQRGLLSRDSVPKEDEMKPMSEFLSELETYPDLEGSIIRATKIHKVLKQIIKLGSIPLEEEFHFKDRSRDLLAKWNETLSNDPAGSGDKDDDKADEPKTPGLPATTNGASATAAAKKEKEKEKEAEKESEADNAAAADKSEEEKPKPATKLENKIGTTVEGAKEANHPKAEAKAQEPAENAEEKKDDGPAVQTAPAGEFKPAPVAETAVEPTA